MIDPDQRTTVGLQLQEATQPLAPDDEEYGDAHAILCETLARPFQQLAYLVDPEDEFDVPPWAPLFALHLCPAYALPWLAQLVGVRIPPSYTDEELYLLINEVAGFKLGTAESLRAAAGAFLEDDKTVYFRERDGDPYILDVVTLDSETPDPNKVLAALLSVKPAGIKLTYRQVSGWDWQQVVTEVATWSALRTEYATWRDVLYKEPS